ncbi:MAG: TspO/MBR family protein [Ruminococcus sp.]|jgi:benzodiazapine receptor
MKIKSWKSLIISLAVALGTGAAAGILNAGSMEQYSAMYRPPLSPPGWVFPAVWTVLYVLMGIAAWLVWISESSEKNKALGLYAAQLAANALWPFLYFRLNAPLAALALLALLWYLVWLTYQSFREISPAAGRLLIPYLIWLSFAFYLNLAIVIMHV